MKKLIAICLLIAVNFTSITYSQEKFNSDEIQLLDNIANNSSFKTIEKFMKKKKYNLQEDSVVDFIKKKEMSLFFLMKRSQYQLNIHPRINFQ